MSFKKVTNSNDNTLPIHRFVNSLSIYRKDSKHDDLEPDWDKDANEITENTYGDNEWEEPQDIKISRKHTINPAM